MEINVFIAFLKKTPALDSHILKTKNTIYFLKDQSLS